MRDIVCDIVIVSDGGRAGGSGGRAWGGVNAAIIRKTHGLGPVSGGHPLGIEVGVVKKAAGAPKAVAAIGIEDVFESRQGLRRAGPDASPTRKAACACAWLLFVASGYGPGLGWRGEIIIREGGRTFALLVLLQYFG